MADYDEESIKNYASISLINEDIIIPQTDLVGVNTDEGNTSSIIFVKANGFSKSGRFVNFNLALKRATKNVDIRNALKIPTLFSQEIKFYREIVPMFQNLQKENKVQQPFNSFVKCFKIFENKEEEILVFENLQEQGYSLSSINEPLNEKQIKLVLDAYSKLHAFSFVLKQKNLEKFKQMTNSYNDCRKTVFYDNPMLGQYFDNLKNHCMDILRKHNKSVLLRKYESHNLIEIMKTAVNADDEHSVILHGDCWNNNYMFNYLDNNKSKPINLFILDWQLTSVGSPIFDLAYFLLANWSPALNLHYLLDYYYQGLEKFLNDLGSNAEEVFPRETFNEHWKKYGKAGLIFSTLNIFNRYKIETSSDTFKVANESEYERVIINFIQFMSDNKVV